MRQAEKHGGIDRSAELPACDQGAGSGWRLWMRQLGWFVLIWALSVAALGFISLIIKMVLRTG